jgi:hypothetical protein
MREGEGRKEGRSCLKITLSLEFGSIRKCKHYCYWVRLPLNIKYGSKAQLSYKIA